MGLMKNFHAGKPQIEKVEIPLQDIGEILSLFIQDSGRNNIAAPDAIIHALEDVKELLEDGFKKESYKGQLYYALHHSMVSIIKNIRECDEDADTVQINFTDLALLKTSYCQLGEAALQYSGSKNILPGLRYLFSNNGYGHGPDAKKYKGQMLHDMVNNSLPAFFKKYPVAEVSDDTLEFYDAPAPKQRLM